MNLEDIYKAVCYIITDMHNWNLFTALLWQHTWCSCVFDSADTLAVTVQDSSWLGK